jgi:predicted RNA-binding Zn-ribbon protein involved in translation (DUF1610 family)
MAHMSPMSDSNTESYAVPCPDCGGDNVMRRTWESPNGAYKDHKYICQDCGHVWWNRQAGDKE